MLLLLLFSSSDASLELCIHQLIVLLLVPADETLDTSLYQFQTPSQMLYKLPTVRAMELTNIRTLCMLHITNWL